MDRFDLSGIGNKLSVSKAWTTLFVVMSKTEETIRKIFKINHYNFQTFLTIAPIAI
jgi:hypothetical protein